MCRNDIFRRHDNLSRFVEQGNSKTGGEDARNDENVFRKPLNPAQYRLNRLDKGNSKTEMTQEVKNTDVEMTDVENTGPVHTKKSLEYNQNKTSDLQFSFKSPSKFYASFVLSISSIYIILPTFRFRIFLLNGTLLKLLLG